MRDTQAAKSAQANCSVQVRTKLILTATHQGYSLINLLDAITAETNLMSRSAKNLAQSLLGVLLATMLTPLFAVSADDLSPYDRAKTESSPTSLASPQRDESIVLNNAYSKLFPEAAKKDRSGPPLSTAEEPLDSNVELIGHEQAPAIADNFLHSSARVQGPFEEQSDITLSDNSKHGFRAFVRYSPSGNRIADALELTEEDFDPDETPLTFFREDREVTLRSFQFLKQHLRHSKGGFIPSEVQSWRATVAGQSSGFEFGWLPVADDRAPHSRLKNHRGGWFNAVRSVGYLGYGMRIDLQTDEYQVRFADSNFGDSSVRTDGTRFATGPVIKIGKVSSRGRWRLDRSVSLMAGYGEIQIDQANQFGSIPPNTLATEYTDREGYFSYFLQAKLGIAYYLTNSHMIDATLRLDGYGPWASSVEAVNVELPAFGIRDINPDEIVNHSVFSLGVTVLR